MSSGENSQATDSQVMRETTTAAVRGRTSAGNPLLRALFYFPVIVLAGTLAAVGMFPELAEYATPLLGKSSSSCKMKANGSSCCAHAKMCQLPVVTMVVDPSLAVVEGDEAIFFEVPLEEIALEGSIEQPVANDENR